MTEWKRPASVPFPSTWRTFEGRQVVNGAKRKYWIQDITEDLIESVVQHMSTGFLLDEPTCKYTKLIEDEFAVKQMIEIWYKTLGQKLGIVCLTKDKDGSVKIAGMNCTGRAYKNEPPFEEDGLSLPLKRVMALINYVGKSKDCFTELNINEYLTALGLFVLPEYRGEGIGLELLKAREALCKAVGFKASLTVFTSIVSQKLAARAGFKDFMEFSYEELEKINPLISFPGITTFTKTVKYMAILY